MSSQVGMSSVLGASGGSVGHGAARSAKVEVVLVSLRSRAFDIHARLAELADLLAQVRDGVGDGRGVTWPDFLNKFDALSTLAEQLCEELERAVGEAGLSHYVIHPSVKAPPMADSEIPELLRTRREPELERDVEALAGSFAGDTNPDALAMRIEEFNEFVEELARDITQHRDKQTLPPMQEPPMQRAPPGANASGETSERRPS